MRLGLGFGSTALLLMGIFSGCLTEEIESPVTEPPGFVQFYFINRDDENHTASFAVDNTTVWETRGVVSTEPEFPRITVSDQIRHPGERMALTVAVADRTPLHAEFDLREGAYVVVTIDPNGISAEQYRRQPVWH